MFRAFRYVADSLPCALTAYVSLDMKLGERVAFTGRMSGIRTEIHTGHKKNISRALLVFVITDLSLKARKCCKYKCNLLYLTPCCLA
jgi:hypothetical protein